MNWILLAGCTLIVFLFQTSTNMEAAHGMAIILNMLMTSLAARFYYKVKMHNFTIPFCILDIFRILGEYF